MKELSLSWFFIDAQYFELESTNIHKIYILLQYFSDLKNNFNRKDGICKN